MNLPSRAPSTRGPHASGGICRGIRSPRERAATDRRAAANGARPGNPSGLSGRAANGRHRAGDGDEPSARLADCSQLARAEEPEGFAPCATAHRCRDRLDRQGGGVGVRMSPMPQRARPDPSAPCSAELGDRNDWNDGLRLRDLHAVSPPLRSPNGQAVNGAIAIYRLDLRGYFNCFK